MITPGNGAGYLRHDLYYAYNIITSAEVQQEYLRICRQSKRKQALLVKEYCLVTDPDLLGAISKLQALREETADETVEKLAQAEEILPDKELQEKKDAWQGKATPCPALSFFTFTYSIAFTRFSKSFISLLENPFFVITT